MTAGLCRFLPGCDDTNGSERDPMEQPTDKDNTGARHTRQCIGLLRLSSVNKYVFVVYDQDVLLLLLS